jgi:hemolysin III
MSLARWCARLREPVSGLTHLAGALLALVGWLVFLVDARHPLALGVALNLYGASLVVLFLASAAYHLIPGNHLTISRLRKLDHSAIYLLIASSYTPLCLFYFRGFYQTGLLSVVWGIAIAGVVLKWCLAHAPRWLNAGIYLLMGWIAVVAVREMFATMPAGALVWLFLGAFFFTAGAGVYVSKKPNWIPGILGFHEVWHIFVLLGCFSHFVIMAAYIAPYAAKP